MLSQREQYNSIPSSYNKNYIKSALRDSQPLDGKLHVITTIFNLCNRPLFVDGVNGFYKEYELHYIRFKEFVERMEKDEPDIVLYIVEMAYGNSPFVVTDETNPRHLQLRTRVPLWHRENMINLAVNRLLPPDWKAFAWVDGDIEFDSPTWAIDALKLLNGHYDIIQLYSNLNFLLEEVVNERPKNFYYSDKVSISHKIAKNYQYDQSKLAENCWSCGNAIACTREFYNLGICLNPTLPYGLSDLLTFCFFNDTMFDYILARYPEKEAILLDQKMKIKINRIKLGYVPGTIIHHFYGISNVRNEATTEFENIVSNINYEKIVSYDASGILIPNPFANQDDVKLYISEFHRVYFRKNKNVSTINSESVDLSDVQQLKIFIRDKAVVIKTVFNTFGVQSNNTWFFLHIASLKINVDITDELLSNLTIIIRRYCNYSIDLEKYLDSNLLTTETVKTKDELILYFFNLHNYVNSLVVAPQFKFEDLNALYGKIPFLTVYSIFTDFFNISHQRPDKISEELLTVKNYFDEHLDDFK